MADDATDTEHKIIAVEGVDAGDVEVEPENVCSSGEVSSSGEAVREVGTGGEILTRVELDLAYSSEKLVNLDMLLMHVAAREGDFEAFSVENDDIEADSAKKALEFHLLSGILDSEVRELDGFMDSLQLEIVDARRRISSCEHPGEFFLEMEAKLHDSEESLKQSKDQVREMIEQSAKFQRELSAFVDDGKGADFPESGQLSDMNAELKMQTAEQQRHILRMLERSLARELDLEKKLAESRQNKEEMKLKLHSTEQELLCMEEAEKITSWRLFEAENATEVLKGITKELMGRLQVVQFNLNGSIQREGEVRSKLQDCIEQLKAKESVLQKLETSNAELDSFLLTETNRLKAILKEAENRYISVNSEAFTLREKASVLEEQLKESEIQLHIAKAEIEASQEQHDALCSELSEMDNTIEDLKKNLSKAVNRAESAEAKCKLLTETNLELNEELGFLKSGGNNMEKKNLIERQLREYEVELQNAKASAEASQKQQNMLYSMENLIKDLKSKVSKAESQTESAEAKCNLLSETNMELNDEISFLRNRMECLELSLHQADNTKIATAKDISIRTKVIVDLVMQLALERERVQKQLTSLMEENRILAQKLQYRKKDVAKAMSYDVNGNDRKILFCKDSLVTDTSTKSPKEVIIESSAASFQVEKPAKATSVNETEVDPACSTGNATNEASKVDTVRTIEAGQLNFKYVFMAVFILLISVLAVYLFQQDSCPFSQLKNK
ncbi:PREDICTED: WPP domain-interacting tail-anchored protein 1-like isoform X2 [Nelumbo nucifera]|uniref:WIT1/2 N-terminal helical bundle domain-containing protein n=2 Tax=Nelumbo nucifera TaxID=4432 RepID=A0A822ZGZ1_NELNU|nr:PREDICTED: WPP domain-interacting tail-anchored protein 1-like isoform X2 [Nelumbo nucifera]DAD42685.1 TPA_asm: hypothetical protein HUJ06_000915 [Nelumbo nucifera]